MHIKYLMWLPLVSILQIAQHTGAATDSVRTVNFDDYTCATNSGTITITGYYGLDAEITIPDELNGLKVTHIGDGAFASCSNLTRIAFKGNAPGIEGDLPEFDGNNLTIYYLPGTTGWEPTFGGRPTEPWKPQVAGDSAFGANTNGFGFTLNWASGMRFVMEACTNLINEAWQPVYTNTLIEDSMYFHDPQWTNYPGRFYRVGDGSVDVAIHEMVIIPAGTNTGVDPDFGSYSLTNTASFYMDKYLVTKAKWDEVYAWAITNGYSFANLGSGKETNHPVQSVNWYDCAKWSNARSEKNGRIPAYYLDPSKTEIYRTGQTNIEDSCVNWSSGYRLPREIEWEYAARGGVTSKRFPWGTDTIDHDKANYYVYSTNSYDSGYPGYDTRYSNSITPYTSPVGAFESGKNGYGLYDMAGNVWEWCWDWHPGYEGLIRIDRGGSWYYASYGCRVGFRDLPDISFGAPGNADFRLGFRTVLPID